MLLSLFHSFIRPSTHLSLITLFFQANWNQNPWKTKCKRNCIEIGSIQLNHSSQVLHCVCVCVCHSIESIVADMVSVIEHSEQQRETHKKQRDLLPTR